MLTCLIYDNTINNKIIDVYIIKNYLNNLNNNRSKEINDNINIL